MLHRGEHMEAVQQDLTQFIKGILQEEAGAGRIRSDVSPDELAEYCIHALSAAANLKTRAAVKRLVTVTLSALKD
jgi:hypothetical protein